MNKINDIGVLSFIGNMNKLDTLLLNFEQNRIKDVHVISFIERLPNIAKLSLYLEYNIINMNKIK